LTKPKSTEKPYWRCVIANRYFINGGSNNNWSDTGNWSTTSGGSGGSAVPTSSDAVYLDDKSPNCNANAGATRNAGSLNCTGYTNTLTMNVQISVFGNMTFVSGMTFNPQTYLFVIQGAGNFTSAGKTFYNMYFGNGAGFTTTLVDDIRVSNAFWVDATSGGTVTFTGNKVILTESGYIALYTGRNIAMTIAGTTEFLFNGSGNQSITSGSSTTLTISNPITVTKNTGTFSLNKYLSLTHANGCVVTAPSYPAITDVRKTTVYGPSNEYTGTMPIPKISKTWVSS